MPKSIRIFLLCLLLLPTGQIGSARGDEPVRPGVFHVRATQKILSQPFSGSVYILFSRGPSEPRKAMNWFDPGAIIRRDVSEWRPGIVLTLDLSDPQLRKFPENLRPRDLAGMTAQAIVRFNPLEPGVEDGVGNGYGPPVTLQRPEGAELTVDRIIPPREFRDTPWTKLFRVRSRLLSDFHHRDVFLNATVTLPASYATQPERRYPVIIEIPGFGGTHLMPTAIHQHPVQELNTLRVEFIRVMLDPSCPLGHHVFANSENNGPCSDALVNEFLPALDAAFRTAAKPKARFLTGHSSGGWSSLWLLVNFPDHFGGTWSTSPDPVDFRDNQQINIYSDRNMYVDERGARRPIARQNRQPVLWYDSFCRMEDVLGDGGQLHSLEAVFSPRGPSGQPKLLWNRQTGAIDHTIAEAWQRYDISLLLTNNWPSLEPKLAGKIHVYMGAEDTFYLDGSTRLLKQTLQRLGSDAVVEILPERDHSNLFLGGLQERIEQSIAERYQRFSENILQN